MNSKPENKAKPKLLPVIIEKKQDRLDMTRAEDEGFNQPAQKESIEEAKLREDALKQSSKKKPI
jgi:hypothetical protein